jgi:thiamine biosynthesis lipoprotein
MIRSAPLMGTIVTIHVVDREADEARAVEVDSRTELAFDWFHRVESCCSRFDADSELMRLTSGQPGVPMAVSALLFEAVQFALAVAEETAGAFDPTVGYELERRGFNREYRSGRVVRTPLTSDPDDGVTYRDVQLDAVQRTITLRRLLILDLGSVAKGLAIDMAARELSAFRDFAIDAGGDLYLAGRNENGNAWSVGIRHPRQDRELIDTIRVSDAAVCTSGDYERRAAGDGGHHIIDPRSSTPAGGAASVTVVAPTAMAADALATAAFVLGPSDGLQLLARQGVDGLIVSPTLDRYATPGLRSRYHLGDAAAAVS